MKNLKSPVQEVEVNPQLIESMKRDLGIDQYREEKKWTPPPRPQIPYHTISIFEKEPDLTVELFDLYQKSKHLVNE